VVTMKMKTCKSCGIEKPVSQYSRCRSMKSGRLNKCKACYSNYFKDYYVEHRAGIRSRENKGLTRDCKRFENIKKAHAKNATLTAKCKKCSNVLLKSNMITLIYGMSIKTKKYICQECFSKYNLCSGRVENY
jgi:hypothetical protein